MASVPVPTLARTGNQVHDRNLDAISTAFRRIGDLTAPMVSVFTTYISKTGKASGLTFGRVHTPWGVATVTGAGITRALVMPADSNRAIFTPTFNEVIYGIDPTDFVDGDSIKLLIRGGVGTTVTLVHLAGTAGVGTSMDIYEIANGGKNVTIDAPAILNFTRDAAAGCLRLER